MDPALVDPDLARRAVELLARNERGLRRAARRVSLCEADVDDAIQRSLEILLLKGGEVDPRRLGAWLVTVTRHEALAVRRARERLLGPPPAEHAELCVLDPLDRLHSDLPEPPERVLRNERVARGLAALAALKPAERTAIALHGQGYSYAEIGELCGWTYTKVNRSLAEGRARLRNLNRSRAAAPVPPDSARVGPVAAAGRRAAADPESPSHRVRTRPSADR